MRGFEGDIPQSHVDRMVFATDNSIYPLAPEAIVFPRYERDVVRVAKVAGEPLSHVLKLTLRSGGTGTNGRSLAEGVSVDLSRYMNAMLTLDRVRPYGPRYVLCLDRERPGTEEGVSASGQWMANPANSRLNAKNSRPGATATVAVVDVGRPEARLSGKALIPGG